MKALGSISVGLVLAGSATGAAFMAIVAAVAIPASVGLWAVFLAAQVIFWGLCCLFILWNIGERR